MSIRVLVSDLAQRRDKRWEFSERITTGKRRQLRFPSKTEAKQARNDLLALVATNRTDLLAIPADEIARIREHLRRPSASVTACELVRLFKESKSRTSTRYQEGFSDLDLWLDYIGPKTDIAEIKERELQQFINSRRGIGDRRRYNLRAMLVTLFRYAVERRLLPEGKTEAERLEKISRPAGEIHVLEPEQMQILLDNVREEFLPWLGIGGFAAVRDGEMQPRKHSTKSPLQWTDFKWERRIIRLRKETAKTGQGKKPRARIIPIPDNLFAILQPWHHAKGPVCPVGVTRERERLGKLIGGWKSNYLRDSAITYAVAKSQDMPAVALASGNSVRMIAESYDGVREESEGITYYSLVRSQMARNVIAMAS